jgi:hypothetical protein
MQIVLIGERRWTTTTTKKKKEMLVKTIQFFQHLHSAMQWSHQHRARSDLKNDNFIGRERESSEARPNGKAVQGRTSKLTTSSTIVINDLFFF